MKNFIDEAGTFTATAQTNSWCVVGCYSIPNHFEKQMEKVFAHLRKTIGEGTRELKVKDLNEHQYRDFLYNLKQLPGIFHAVVTDSSSNTLNRVRVHQKHQVDELMSNITRMQYDEGKEAVRNTSERLQSLSAQLYIQLVCQIQLMYRTLKAGIMYYVQRYPEDLSNFSWYIDAKDKNITEYEELFEVLSPMLLQTFSFYEPILVCKEFDYSYMEKYLSSWEHFPEYLKEIYDGDDSVSGFNVQKMIRDDIQFVDSFSSTGIQVANMLVSGLRRCLRMEWEDNESIACAIGSLMVQQESRACPLYLISLNDVPSYINKEVQHILQEIMSKQRKMFVNK